jgi:hypothetical protein
MPNWAEGTLKIRGTRENIRNFVLNGLKPLATVAQVFASVKGEPIPETKGFEVKSDDEDNLWIESEDGFGIEGATRNFIDSNYIDIYWNSGDEDIVTFDYKAAWGPDTEALLKLAKKYEIDIRIYVFENGMEYNAEFEVSRTGDVILNREIKFDDYKWQCPMPNMGG